MSHITWYAYEVSHISQYMLLFDHAYTNVEFHVCDETCDTMPVHEFMLLHDGVTHHVPGTVYSQQKPTIDMWIANDARVTNVRCVSHLPQGLYTIAKSTRFNGHDKKVYLQSK